MTKQTEEAKAAATEAQGLAERSMAAVPQSQAQAAIEGLTGRYLVLLEEGNIRTAERTLSSTAGIQMDHVASGDSAAIDSRSIDEGRGLLFPQLGVAVVNPRFDQVASVSIAVAQSDQMQVMEPERFVYSIGEFDAAYLRGFRDAVVHLYDTLTAPEQSLNGIGTSAIAGNDQYSWGLIATRVNAAKETGLGVKIAILDTGIDLSHPDFQGRTVSARSFIKDENEDDGHGHGTHCAGVACGPKQPRSLPRFGVATEAELLVGKVLANSGRGTDSSIIAGIQWAMGENAHIVSMSLGSPVTATQNYSPIFEQIGQRAIRQGTLLIAAAGNDSNRPRGLLCPVSHPANCPSIMSVGAIDRHLNVGWFSNAGVNINGGKIDIVGPGVEIRSTWPGAQYKHLDGTSMATPHVAGIAALYAQRDPTLRGDALWARLVQQAQPLNAPARDVGAGLVQAPQ